MGKMRQFRRMIRGCVNKPLLYHAADGYGAVLFHLFERVARGDRVHDADIHELMSAARAGEGEDSPEPKRVVIAAGPTVVPGAGPGKAVAVVPVRGIATYDLEYQPYCFSTVLLGEVMNRLSNDPEIGSIVLDIDSPGGQVTGTKAAADAVYAAAKKKKVTALINPLSASAAYWIASQATEILAEPSADIGSIGVFMAHTDCSKFNEMQGMKITYIHAGEYKVEGNSNEPLSDEGKDYYQGEVDSIYRDFIKAVARGRKTTVEDVLENFGKGRTMMAPVAKKIGMIDDFMTIGAALARCGVASTPSQHRRSEETAPDVEAQAAYDAMVAGVEHITFTQEVSDDGTKKVFVTPAADHEAWPAKVAIVPDLVVGDSVFAVSDDIVSIFVDNGAAQYKRIGIDFENNWVCERVGCGLYSPMPAASATAAEPVTDEPDGDGGTEIATAEPPGLTLNVAAFLGDAERKRAAAARSRRLELLRA